MSEEIRTPGGRVLRLMETNEDGDVAEYRGHSADLTRRPVDRVSSVRALRGEHRGTIDECLRWLDARADETVAALLPPGAIVVTEERVRELAKVLVDRYAESGDGCASEDCQKPHIDALLSALRAGAKS